MSWCPAVPPDRPAALFGGVWHLPPATADSPPEGLSSETGTAPKTTVTLTHQGRAALDAYTKALRGLLNGL